MIAFLASYAQGGSFYEALELLKKISFLTSLDEKELSNLNSAHSTHTTNALALLLHVSLGALLNYYQGLSSFLSFDRRIVTFPIDYGDEQKIFLGFVGPLEEDTIRSSLSAPRLDPLKSPMVDQFSSNEELEMTETELKNIKTSCYS